MELLLFAVLALVGALRMTGAGISPAPGGKVDPDTFLAKLRSMSGMLYALGAGQAGKPPHPPYTDCGLFIADGLRLAGGPVVTRTITEQVAEAPYKRNVQGMSRAAFQALLQPGDCVAFDFDATTPRYNHGVVWTGSGYIHASSSKGKVVESPATWYSSGWRTIYSWCR